MLGWLDSQLHVREATGRNDGAEVEAYQRVTGNSRGAEWCGSYQAAANQHCGLPFPAAAGAARYWFRPESPRTYFIRALRGSTDAIEPGHKVGFYYGYLGRIGHIGCVVARTRNGFVTNEGNTGRGGGRTGAGVHRLTRSKGEIYAASNWLY